MDTPPAQKARLSLAEQVKQAGFVAIGKGAFLSAAHKDGVVRSNRDARDSIDAPPNVIIMFGWMGGTFRHLSHYAKGYAELYPQAAQVVVLIEPRNFFSRKSTQDKALQPIMDTLGAVGCLPDTQTSTKSSQVKILTHMFSNGGGLQSTRLANLIRRRSPGSVSARSALVHDSMPGVGNLRTTLRAFAVGVPSLPARLFLYAFLSVMHFLGGIVRFLFGIPNVIECLRSKIEDPNFLPWVNKDTPRLYVYSKADGMVMWEEVRDHVQRLRDKGLDVKEELYMESGHVAHMPKDRARYWNAVANVWKASYRGENSA